MTEDIARRIRKENLNMNMGFTAKIYHEALIVIEDLCLEIANKVVKQLGIPSATRSAAASFKAELRHKQNYNMRDPFSYVQSNIPNLTLEQNEIYHQVMQTVDNGVGEIFFLDAPRGTGKAFLITLILEATRSRNNIALALASSGIAAILLPGGRTAHSALKLSSKMQFIETPTCNISKPSGIKNLLPMNSQWRTENRSILFMGH
jgi:tRNA(Met) C34 N-acetyltransferase TmcA